MPEAMQDFARQLRRSMTDAEKRLWYHLRDRQLNGVKFKRQQVLGRYIVDFVCFETRLVIELDGGQHLDRKADISRDAWLRAQGFEVLRFWNNDVLKDTAAVPERIDELTAPSPQPLSREGRGAKDAHASAGDKSLERVRWRCRRGMLELDIVLGRFVERRYSMMDDSQRAAFDELLDLPDTDLWDLVCGKRETEDQRLQTVLDWMRAS